MHIRKLLMILVKIEKGLFRFDALYVHHTKAVTPFYVQKCKMVII